MLGQCQTTITFILSGQVCASTPTLSPLSPPSPALVAGEDGLGRSCLYVLM